MSGGRCRNDASLRATEIGAVHCVSDGRLEHEEVLRWTKTLTG